MRKNKKKVAIKRSSYSGSGSPSDKTYCIDFETDNFSRQVSFYSEDEREKYYRKIISLLDKQLEKEANKL